MPGASTARRDLVLELDQDLIDRRSDPSPADLAEDEALRGHDAVHLAAALTIEADVVTSADVALCDAAERRGLHVANPLDR